jgi:hypothetical protein
MLIHAPFQRAPSLSQVLGEVLEQSKVMKVQLFSAR